MTEAPFPHVLERVIVIRARPRRVFAFFQSNDRWARWWGAGSTIDPVAGGAVGIRYPNGVDVVGRILEIDPPHRLSFTFGFASGSPMPPESSRVTIRLEPHAGGTRLHLRHEFADASARDQHVQGWRYQLSVFANIVADEMNAGAAGLVDAWFRAWSESDAAACEKTLADVASPTVEFRDRFSLVEGLADLIPHIAATHRFTPLRRIARQGDTRHCQGTVVADWQATGADGHSIGGGTNVFTLDADGRIAAVVGIWHA